MSPLEIVVIGSHDYLPHLLKSLDNSGRCEVIAVVSDNETSLSIESVEKDIEVHRTDSINSERVRSYLNYLDPDLGVCFGWYEVIDNAVLQLPTEGIIGIHAAPLPVGRGQAPVNWQIIYGYEEATVSIFRMTQSVDAGPIHGQHTVQILPGEDIVSLYDRLVYFGIEELCAVVNRIAVGEDSPRDQDSEAATYWPARRPKDSLIDWAMGSDVLDRFVRGLSGAYPSAHTYLDGERIDVGSLEVCSIDTNAPSGEVIEVDPPDSLLVSTATGAVAIDRIGTHGSPQISGSEFASRRELSRGDRLAAPHDYPEEFRYMGIRGSGGRTDLQLQTNASTGAPVKNCAYVFAPGGIDEVQITASMNDTQVFETVTSVDGNITVPIKVTVPKPETNVFEIAINGDNQERVLIYGH